MEATFLHWLQRVFLYVHLWFGEALGWFSGSDPLILEVDQPHDGSHLIATEITDSDLCRAALSTEPAGNIAHIPKQRQTNTCLWAAGVNCFAAIVVSASVRCVWPGSALLWLALSQGLATQCYTRKVTEAGFFSFDMGDWPWGITLAVDHHLWEDKVFQLENEWILLIPREIINRVHLGQLSDQIIL